jgi:hypothetical protein
MKPSGLAIISAVAALSAILAGAPACGSGRVPEKSNTFIAQCTWTLDDYAKKADGLSLKAETMQSPFREDAQYKIFLMNDKIEEGRARLEEFKTATGSHRTELIAEITAIMKEIGRLYDEAEATVGGK